MSELVVAEDVGQEVVPVQSGEVTLFRTDDPAEIVEKATGVARVLAKVLKDQKLTATISGREHVLVEGWTLCGTMLGVFPVCTWTRPVEDGWEARVEARTRDGSVVGAAEAECLRSEKTWKTRDDYALRSMAQTRATSKALRLPLGFIVSLAGFEATPAEEMPDSGAREAMDKARETASNVILGDANENIVVHWGYDKGKRLGELSEKSLEYLAFKWEPKAEYATDQDWALKQAAKDLITPF